MTSFPVQLSAGDCESSSLETQPTASKSEPSLVEGFSLPQPGAVRASRRRRILCSAITVQCLALRAQRLHGSVDLHAMNLKVADPLSHDHVLSVSAGTPASNRVASCMLGCIERTVGTRHRLGCVRV